MTPSEPSGTWTIVSSTCEMDSFIVWKETATAMELGTQTSLLRSLEGRGGHIDFPLFLAWPTHSITSERAPCSVQFPGARQAIRPLRNFTSHRALMLPATEKEWKFNRKQRNTSCKILSFYRKFLIGIKIIWAGQRSKYFSWHNGFWTTAVVSIFNYHINAWMRHKTAAHKCIVTIWRLARKCQINKDSLLSLSLVSRL